MARIMYPISAGVLLLICAGIFTYGALVRSDRVLCAESGNRALCYTTHLESVLGSKGVVAALELLSSIYETDTEFRRYCHGNVHDIGKAAYKLYRSQGVVETTGLASYCGFGYYHGFMEEMFAETGSLQESKEFCHRIGEQMKGIQQYAEGACYHGIGHGVTDGTDPADWGDPVALTTPGLTLCRDIADTDEWLMRCSSGVFNSLAQMYKDEQYQLGKPDNPFSVCVNKDLLEPERISCYSQMNTLVAFLADHDGEKALAYTDGISDATLKRVAIVSIAAMPRQWRGREEDSVPICRSIESDFVTACLRGVVSGMMEFGVPGEEEIRALQYCSDDRLNAHEQRECMTEIISMSRGMFPKAKVQDICTRIPSHIRPVSCIELSA